LEDCNACTQVCPSGALQPLELPDKRKHIIGEALVDATLCLLTLGKKDCNVCERACPFEAISIVWDENAYVAYPAINARKCNGCGACEVVCPTSIPKAIRVWKV
jgi:formate hydrogenlyase subunit 6/NADH:ubiquinone oxidoreductase subunit I